MMRTHLGGCHCGRVRFEVLAPAAIEVDDCDCSMCRKAGFLHLIVPKERFRLLAGRSPGWTAANPRRIALARSAPRAGCS